ncbi:MAG TPA: biotin/lipoyl-binding protein [Candidatus Cloacimonadota bacterium]|nr:biotin/lipoyl-binding protein [Candidatus Cloacimonadota bacterium]
MKIYKMTINGEKYNAKIKEYKGNYVLVEVNGIDYGIELEVENKPVVQLVRSQKSSPALNVTKSTVNKQPAQAGSVLAPIPGLVLRILVKEGDTIHVGDTILVLEAMKMESEIASTASGIVKSINVKEGSSVQEDDVLITVGE